MPFSQLHPALIWRHFERLCAIPRPSRHEDAVRAAICGWADSQGIAWRSDPTGNLILSKPASAGREHLPGVILQGHLDMVCEKHGSSGHDFRRDPIRPRLADGWLLADDTTLGADNGIGVAMALAVLEAHGLAHPPLQVLLTVDEESGMSGAHGLAADALSGAYLINLDTEDWGEVYLGCAGGLDLLASHDFALEAAPAGFSAWTLAIDNLQGGHSGVDIHLERGNALRLLVRTLIALAPLGGRLAALEGGTARNALPREARALWLAPASHSAVMAARIHDLADSFAAELAAAGDAPRVLLEPADVRVEHVLCRPHQTTLLNLLNALPQGVRRMSRELPGVVETSNNLGIARLSGGRFEAVLMIRSLRESGCQDLAASIESICTLAGVETSRSGAYPGWTPDPAAPLLACFQKVHRACFGREAVPKVIHAGLECGILAARYPELQMISFGPTIRGAHAPGERVEVATVAQAWTLLTALLAALPPS